MNNSDEFDPRYKTVIDREVDADEPSGELGPTRAIEDGVREALRTVLAKPRQDPVSGKFIAGAVGGATKTLATSALLLEALGPVKRDLVARVLADRGVNGDAAETLLGFVDAYCEARLLRQSMWIRMIEQGGPVTGKGKKRALFDAYLGALDRETRLAQTIGLERHSRQVVSPLDFITGKVERG